MRKVVKDVFNNFPRTYNTKSSSLELSNELKKVSPKERPELWNLWHSSRTYNTEEAFKGQVLRMKLRVNSASKRLEVKEISRQIN
jgi:hypothetical protein